MGRPPEFGPGSIPASHHFLLLVAPATAPAQAPTPLVWILEAVSGLFSYRPLTVPLPPGQPQGATWP